ncbi:MAG: hypothetical protein F6J90_31405 [Moorea sp. SIOASIH]|uniref:hypothetical protein n=1 Tax=Moorena sp. SIOASIH TaxID=2607817 RepID=UPI0013BA28E4|nr:hypothetical protein [Moorena sp. SIOASIH]NEO40597.1 hypothetical protein [Moorena sp. SIOASIH]
MRTHCASCVSPVPVSAPAKVTQQPKAQDTSGRLQKDHKCSLTRWVERASCPLQSDGLSQHWLRGAKLGLARP